MAGGQSRWTACAVAHIMFTTLGSQKMLLLLLLLLLLFLLLLLLLLRLLLLPVVVVVVLFCFGNACDTPLAAVSRRLVSESPARVQSSNRTLYDYIYV